MTTAPEGLEKRVRLLLARVLEKKPEEVMALPARTPLFGEGLSLDSLSGMELLAAVDLEFGVDIASDDLNLDSLESIGTLVAYLSSTLQSDSEQRSR